MSVGINRNIDDQPCSDEMTSTPIDCFLLTPTSTDGILDGNSDCYIIHDVTTNFYMMTTQYSFSTLSTREPIEVERRYRATTYKLDH